MEELSSLDFSLSTLFSLSTAPDHFLSRSLLNTLPNRLTPSSISSSSSHEKHSLKFLLNSLLPSPLPTENNIPGGTINASSSSATFATSSASTPPDIVNQTKYPPNTPSRGTYTSTPSS